MSVRGACAALVLAALVSGCAVRGPVAPAGPPTAWVDRLAALEQIGRWRLSGRLALRTAQESVSGSIRWWQGERGFDLRLHGAFGRGALHLTENSAGARLERADEPPMEAASAAVLLADALPQTPLPVDNLRYWVLGRPAPGAVDTLLLDGANRLRVLRQDGWQIEYTEYRPVPPWSLPVKLKARRGDIELRLAIRDWMPGADAP
ncbi:MAG: lipoprotein insertase outer membrane protein LolB [Immundisolibacter sp.]